MQIKVPCQKVIDACDATAGPLREIESTRMANMLISHAEKTISRRIATITHHDLNQRRRT